MSKDTPQYTPLPQKFRPQKFDEVVGQEHIVTGLSNMIRMDRYPPAFLFSGSRGLGKTTIARILARSMNCKNRKPNDIEPCNNCQSCLDSLGGSNLDIIEVDGASNRGVNDIKVVLQPTKHYPHYSRFKILIIDEVHRLSKEAFDSTLKIVEEPPPHVKFIFCTTQKYSVPVTIISRCSDWDFRLVAADRIAIFLEKVLKREEVPVEKSILKIISRQGGGSVRDSLSYLDNLLASCNYDLSDKVSVTEKMGVVRNELFFQILLYLIKQDAATLFSTVEKIVDSGQAVDIFLDNFIRFLNDLLAVKIGFVTKEDLGLVEKDFRSLKSISDNLSLEVIVDLCDKVLKREKDYHSYENQTLVLRLLFSELLLLWKK